MGIETLQVGITNLVNFHSCHVLSKNKQTKKKLRTRSRYHVIKEELEESFLKFAEEMR